MPHVKKHDHVPIMVRVDAGIENYTLENFQIAFRMFHNDSMSGYNSVGRSTANQELKCFGFFFRETLLFLGGTF
jgi:hypothetical protein